MIDLSNNEYLIFNNNTLIEIDTQAFSFITLIPCKSIPATNWKELSENTAANYFNSILKPFLTSIDVFEIPTMLSKGELGTLYKVIHYYERGSIMQNSLLSDTPITKRKASIGRDKRQYSRDEFFIQSKKQLKAETIANYKMYEKTDFIVVKTMFRHKKILTGEEKISESGEVTKIDGLDIGKSKTLLDYFTNYTSELWNKDSQIIESFFIEHFNRYDQIESLLSDSSVEINKDNLIKWFSKLSLSTNKTSIEDENFIKNNILNYSPQYTTKYIKITPEESGLPLKFIEVHPNYISITNRKTGKKVIKKLELGEEVEIKSTTNSININRVHYSNTIKKSSLIDQTPKTTKFNFSVAPYEPSSKAYYINELPPAIPAEFSAKLANSLIKALSPETFVQQLEIFRLPQKQLIKQYESRINSLQLFSMIPHLNGQVYDKRAVIDKINALTASINQVADDNFLSIRYSFGHTKAAHSTKDDTEVSNALKKLNIDGHTPIIRSLDKLMLPWSYSPYILNKEARSTFLELPEFEVSKFINFKFGQTPLSFDKTKSKKDLLQANSSNFFVKSDDEVYGVDIFKGPEKFNGLIIAPSGSGKSFFAVNMLDGFISSSPSNLVWILDRGGSFYKFTDTYGGVNKELTLSSDKNSINPFGLNLSLVLMVKLQMFEKIISNKTNEDDSEGVECSDELILEIKETIRLVKSLSNASTATFYLIDDADSLNEYDRMPDSSKQKLDIFHFLLKGKKVTIKTEFYMTQVQDTFAVLASIVLSMLASDKKSEDVKTALQAATPPVIRKLFLQKLEKELSGKSFVEDYSKTTNKIISKFSFTNLSEISYDSILSTNPNSANDDSNIYIKFPEETLEYSNTNVYFIIDELKAEFLTYFEATTLINKDEIIPHLDELDFYIDNMQAGKLFNVEPPKDLSNERLVNIDLGESQDERLTTVVPSAIMMNFFKVLTAPSKKGSNKILLIDEAHAILGSSNTSGLDAIAYLFRTARKHGGAIWLISQGIGDFHQPNDPIKSQKFEALVKNAGWRVLLGSGHENTKEVLGFSGASIEFAKKSKEGAEKYKMVIDMDGKSINVVDLVVSATDYWNSTTHATEKHILDVLTLMTRDPQYAKTIAALTFPDPMGGMRNTYPTEKSLQDANPKSSEIETYKELMSRTNIDYTDLEKTKVQQQYKTIKALLSETDKKQVSMALLS